jgi:hypothetical protein
MTALVTLAEVKAGLRIDTTDDDALLQLLIGAASESVINYLKAQAAELFDLDAAQGNSPQDADVPDVIKNATIFLTGVYYRNSDGDADKNFTPGYLPAPVISMLYSLRDPAIA